MIFMRRPYPTVGELIDRFAADYLPKKRESTRRDYQAMLENIVRPELGKTKVVDLPHADIDRLHRKVSERAPYREGEPRGSGAVQDVELCRQTRMARGKAGEGLDCNPEEQRYRYLTYNELRRLTKALANHSSRDAANAVRLLLLIGARRGEVLSATWDQFDLAAGVWTKPSSYTKQKARASRSLVSIGTAATRRYARRCRTPRRGVTLLVPGPHWRGADWRYQEILGGAVQGGRDQRRPAERFTPYLRKSSRQRGTAVGETVIEARGIAHRIRFTVDPIRQEPRISCDRASSSVKTGTRVTVRWPAKACQSARDMTAVFYQSAGTTSR